MDEALVLALGFVVREPARNGFGASYAHPHGWRISGPDRFTSWAIFDDNHSLHHHIDSAHDLLEIVYNFGVESGKKYVKDTIRDMFGTRK